MKKWQNAERIFLSYIVLLFDEGFSDGLEKTHTHTHLKELQLRKKGSYRAEEQGTRGRIQLGYSRSGVTCAMQC